ncbi:uncharacterized protein EI90DRAFT_511214 [Cantharellus anzutake]|uniref:uncharacterized protein n=1 Tax=Cantharellus anzutake TaxID=1750568 RepID=UPI0019077A4D|nr:uncharacterized protein EI90DRAFT_511214 [Cantharellus anzutake]KAF8334124.1 hypothetical protein EI90DRAFT_511214 [Cantharellus anzutake]
MTAPDPLSHLFLLDVNGSGSSYQVNKFICSKNPAHLPRMDDSLSLTPLPQVHRIAKTRLDTRPAPSPRLSFGASGLFVTNEKDSTQCLGIYIYECKSTVVPRAKCDHKENSGPDAIGNEPQVIPLWVLQTSVANQASAHAIPIKSAEANCVLFPTTATSRCDGLKQY